MTDFFRITTYSESSAEIFGLCENESRPHVYADKDNGQTWLSTVLNPDGDERRFIPVKNCLLIDPACDDNTKVLCTGLLIYTDYLVFAEVKNTQEDTFKDWLKCGAERLKNTIQIFKNNHNIDNYQNRSAYLAYKNKRLVPTSNSVLKNQFVLETGIQLFINHEIEV